MDTNQCIKKKVLIKKENIYERRLEQSGRYIGEAFWKVFRTGGSERDRKNQEREGERGMRKQEMRDERARGRQRECGKLSEERVRREIEKVRRERGENEKREKRERDRERSSERDREVQ